MKRYCYRLLLFLLIALTGCDLLINRSATSPPGYHSPVYLLLLTKNDFPEGWELNFNIPDNVKAPATNHVGVEWSYKTGEGLVMQSIWRSYTVSEAELYFKELRQTRYGPNRTLPPNIKYLEFVSPQEFKYQSKVADEFYFACGVLENAYCITLVRYRNYVVLLNTELKGKIGDYMHTGGLTYEEIEQLLESMDKIFMGFLASYP